MTDHRFWARVEKTETCWLWTGSMSNGYGTIGRLRDGKMRITTTHRFAYEETKGKIPPGMYVRHLCHVRACVRPDHLALGTAADNGADTAKAGRARNGYTGPLSASPMAGFLWCAGGEAIRKDALEDET